MSTILDISMGNTQKTQKIKRKVRDDIQKPSGPGLPHFLATMSFCSVLLPPMRQLPEEFRQFLVDSLIDKIMKETLEEAKVINWCRTARPLWPLSTRGDGNCLLHAVSLALWGIHDNLQLRKLVYLALVQDGPSDNFKRRWKRERGFLNEQIPDGGLRYNTGEWTEEWEVIVQIAEDVQREDDSNRLPYDCLEEIHIFVLANVLRRPIVVLSDSVVRSLEGSTLAPANVGGIYLPLLWESEQCVKSPVLLGYDSSHFTALVGNKESTEEAIVAIQAENVVPLVTYEMTQLHLHFLLEDEEKIAYQLLQNYFNVKEIVFSTAVGVNEILCARLEYKDLGEDDLMKDFYQDLERRYRHAFHGDLGRGLNKQQEKKALKKNGEGLDLKLSEVFTTQTSQTVCIMPSCQYFGNADFGGRCYQCFLKYTQERNNEASMQHLEQTPVMQLRRHSQSNGIVDPQAVNTSTNPSSPSAPPLSYPPQTRGGESSPLTETPPGQVHQPQASPAVRQVSRSTAEFVHQSEVIPSIASEECIELGCVYMASRKTYPYCHEHKDLDTAVQRPLNRLSLSEQHLNASVSDPEISLETHQSKSLDFDRLHPGTSVFHDNQLRDSKKNYTNPQEKSKRKSAELLLGVELQVQHDDKMHEKRGRNVQKRASNVCRNSDCDAQGQVRLRGFCDTCFLLLKPQEEAAIVMQETMQQASKHSGSSKPDHKKKNMPGDTVMHKSVAEHKHVKAATSKTMKECLYCHKQVLDFPKGFCEVCSYQVSSGTICLPPASLTNVSNHTKKHHGSSKKRPSGGESAPPLDIEEKHLCATPGCEGVRCKGMRDLCYYCFEAVKRGMTPMPNQEKPQTTGSTQTPPDQNQVHTPPVASVAKSARPASQQSLLSYEKHLLMQEQCKTPGCVRAGYESTEGYCNVCSQKKYHETARTLAEPPVDRGSADEARKSRTKCVTPGCKWYGAEENMGLCSQCLLERLEEGDKKDKAKQCKTKGCTMFGTTELMGYCSRCFEDKILPEITQRRQRVEAQSLQEGSWGSEGTTSAPCITPNCHFFGDPNMDGMCTKCYYYHFARSKQVHAPKPKANVQVKKTIIDPVSGPADRHGSIIAPYCLSPGCDYYGDPNLDNLCTRCYAQQLEAIKKPVKAKHHVASPKQPQTQIINMPLDIEQIQTARPVYGSLDMPPALQTTPRSGQTKPSPVEQMYQKTAQKIVIGSKSATNMCKTKGCTNYGNSKCFGYCNTCYPGVQAKLR